jgi:exopolysaccharide biosynthesis protein
LNETAQVMKQIGCVDGLTLDGGGSSCLLINNIEANIPLDGK